MKRLVVVAATNRPDVIDPALLRPGRLDRLVYVPPPDKPSRRDILQLSLAKVPKGVDVDPEELAERTDGFSGAEVSSSEPALFPMIRNPDHSVVWPEHLYARWKAKLKSTLFIQVYYGRG